MGKETGTRIVVAWPNGSFVNTLNPAHFVQKVAELVREHGDPSCVKLYPPESVREGFLRFVPESRGKGKDREEMDEIAATRKRMTKAELLETIGRIEAERAEGKERAAKFKESFFTLAKSLTRVHAPYPGSGSGEAALDHIRHWATESLHRQDEFRRGTEKATFDMARVENEKQALEYELLKVKAAAFDKMITTAEGE